jgi:hypothetical protein
MLQQCKSILDKIFLLLYVKVTKRENFDLAFITSVNHIWVGDIGTVQKKIFSV